MNDKAHKALLDLFEDISEDYEINTNLEIPDNAPLDDSDLLELSYERSAGIFKTYEDIPLKEEGDVWINVDKEEICVNRPKSKKTFKAKIPKDIKSTLK